MRRRRGSNGSRSVIRVGTESEGALERGEAMINFRACRAARRSKIAPDVPKKNACGLRPRGGLRLGSEGFGGGTLMLKTMRRSIRSKFAVRSCWRRRSPRLAVGRSGVVFYDLPHLTSKQWVDALPTQAEIMGSCERPDTRPSSPSEDSQREPGAAQARPKFLPGTRSKTREANWLQTIDVPASDRCSTARPPGAGKPGGYRVRDGRRSSHRRGQGDRRDGYLEGQL